MRLRLSTVLLLALALGLPGRPSSVSAQEAPFKVVANTANPASAVSRGELSQIFMRKVKTWADGQKTAPVDQPDTAAVRDAFSRAIHREAAAGIKAYWLQQVFSGRMVPPSELPSDAEVVAFVRANAGAVGYVSAGAATRGVKVLEVND